MEPAPPTEAPATPKVNVLAEVSPTVARPVATAPMAAVVDEAGIGIAPARPVPAEDSAPRETAAAMPVTAQPVKPSRPSEPLAALDDEGGVQVSPRAPARPKHFAELKPKQTQPVQQKAPAKKKAPAKAAPAQVARSAAAPAQGNASVNAIQGTETGSSKARAAQASQGSGKSKAAGTAAAANYGGTVLRAISRAKRGSLDTNKRVLVKFSISGSGALASVSVARSSGNARADRPPWRRCSAPRRSRPRRRAHAAASASRSATADAGLTSAGRG